MVSLLLQQGGCGALHYASYGGYTDIVQILLNYNADINIMTKVIQIKKIKFAILYIR